MIIAIDLTSLSYHMTGIERYAMCVSEKMLEQDKNNKYILIFRGEIHPVFKPMIDDDRIKACVINGKNKLLFYQIILPICLYKIKADKYLFFAFTSPLLFVNKGIYNTIHDMGPWDSAESLKCLQKFYWKTTIRHAARISKGIITVSEFSKQRIASILGTDEDKIRVIHSAVYHALVSSKNKGIEEIKEMYHLPEKYIMTLSTLEPRKNMLLLLEAYCNILDKVDYDLVLVGRRGWKMDEILENFKTQSRVHITGYVADEYIPTIYKNALCFVFPSLYEGFGLPPIEALTFGTPVVASDANAIQEVLMDQAIYFKNNSRQELENILKTLEKEIDFMPRELNDYQKENYDFAKSAIKVIEYIS